MQVLLLIAMSMMAPQHTGPRTISGKVSEVITGSKIVVSSKGKSYLVTLREAVCPEERQAGYDMALSFTEDKLYGQFVIVTVDRINDQMVLGEIQYVNNGNISYDLLASGMAFWNEPEAKLTAYRELGKKAKKAKTGIFANGDAIPPWDIAEHNNAERKKIMEEKKKKN